MKALSKARPRNPFDAIVVGSGLNALGVMRSLGAGGVRVASVATSPGAPPVRSRYCSEWLQSPSEPSAIISALATLTESAARPVPTFLTEEALVQAIADGVVTLPKTVNCRLPARDTLGQLLDKHGFDRICEQHGFPVPRTVTIRNGITADLLRSLAYPCIVKPGTKTPEYAAHFKKAYIVDSEGDAHEVATRLAEAVGSAVVQEWIPGGDEQIYFCLQYVTPSEVIASFVGRKLRSWPPMFGGTASCTAAPPRFRDALTEQTTRFFRVTGFQGMGSMEFKIDPRSGRPYLIEPTVGRTDFQEESATVNGINIPLAAYCHEVGRPLPQMRYRDSPRVWLDASTLRHIPIRQRVPATASAAFSKHALWRWSDPAPGMTAAMERVTSAISRRVKRV